MPKLEYKSESDDDEGKNSIVSENPVPEAKAKKPRNQKQIDATNKMREALKDKREKDKQLKSELEAKMDETLNHKLIKKEINKKVNMKLKQIVETNNDDVSDSEEEVIIIPKKKSVKPKPPQVKAEPKAKTEPTYPPIQKQQGFVIKFF